MRHVFFAFRTEFRLDLFSNEEQPGFVTEAVKLALAMSYTGTTTRSVGKKTVLDPHARSLEAREPWSAAWGDTTLPVL